MIGQITQTSRRPDPYAVTLEMSSIWQPGQITEVRAFDAIVGSDRYPTSYSGYFDSLEAMATEVGTIVSATGVYFILNDVERTLLNRSTNRLRRAKKGESTQDSNIVRRRWMLIDVDVVRPSGISSTDEEHQAAIRRAEEIAEYLRGLQFPAPVIADSGNGAHVLVRVDLPADDGGLIKRVLESLAHQFDDDLLKIDRGVYNPARLCRLYGTWTCKGDYTEERPHRMACILSAPNDMEVASRETLESIAMEHPGVVPEQSGNGQPFPNGRPFDIDRFIRAHALDVEGPEDWLGGQGSGRRWVFRESPVCEHHDGAAFILQHASGAVTAGCHHNSCPWTWADLREQFEPSNAPARTRLESPDDLDLNVDPWPEPPIKEAYHGLLGDIVDVIGPHSEADPAALLVQTLLAFGNVVGRTAHFRAEADRHYGNNFACLVGATSKGRKGSSWGQIGRLFNQTDEEWFGQRVLGGLSSGEGLVYAVRDPQYKTVPIKKGGRIVDYEEQMVDSGVSDKRLFVLESEFASVLKVVAREKNTLSALMRQAWDKGDLQTLTKNSPTKATAAHISIVGHITRNELRRLITETDLANGLANRFLWVCVRRSQCLPDGGNLSDEELRPLACALADAVEFARDVGQVRRDDEARQIWHEVYPELSTGKPGLLGAATSRAEAHVMRIAVLYALLDQSDRVRAEHLRAALALWRYCEQSAQYIFGSALGDPMADEILRALRNHPDGMTRDEIRNHFNRNKSAQEIARALSVLQEANLVERHQRGTGGRPAQVWRAKR